MSRSAEQPFEEEAAGALFTWRSILMGMVMCLVLGIVGPYWTFYLVTSQLFLVYSLPGVMFLLFVFVLVFNGLLRVASPKIALKPGEVIVVAAMMLVGGAVTIGLAGFLIPNMTAPYYFFTPTNQWQAKLWPYLAEWMSPLDRGGGTTAIESFYLGLATGESIPWRPWVKPLLRWSIFLAPSYLCMMAIMTIMRKQWVEYERLSFPIAQVPQALCSSAADPWGRTSIFRSALFWAGFLLPFIVVSLGGLNAYFPSVPKLSLSYGWGRILPFSIGLSFAILGFAFLVPNKIAFSLWSLNLTSFLVRYHMTKYDLGMQESLPRGGVANATMAHMGMGAMLVFVAGGLWLSRRHLKRVFRCAFGLGERGYDENEPCSYRTALALLILTTVVMLVWLSYSGLALPHATLFVAVTMLIFFGMTRIVAQCGVAATASPMIARDVVMSSIGTANIPAQGISSMVMVSFGGETMVMNSSAHGMYLARRKGRGLMWAMMLGLVTTAVTATLLTLYLGYSVGALNLMRYFFYTAPVIGLDSGLRAIDVGTGANVQGYFWTGVGAAIMSVLMVAQRTLFWWPIHPVGFIICSVIWTDWLWFSIFLAWLIKGVLVRLGGNRMFRMGRRFFLGMILGQFTAAGVWAVIDTVTGKMGNWITST